MSLYLAVFSEEGEEIDGFQVGTYSDYGRFIDTVKANVKLEVCKLLTEHHDSDGFWTTDECNLLINELEQIKNTLSALPPSRIDFDWATDFDYKIGRNLDESLQNVDEEPMTSALIDLCKIAVRNNAKLHFQ